VNLSALRTRLAALHHHEPQIAMSVEHAIRELESGLGTLAKYGHPMHLDEGHEVQSLGWPRLLFHVDSAPNGRLVNSEWDARDLGPDWWPTLAEAQHADGVKTQFAGRGGVQGRSLPVVIPQTELHSEDDAERVARMIEEWKELRSQRDGT